MKIYEAPHAQIVSFKNDYVATAVGGGDEASPAGLIYVVAGSCSWSTGDPILLDCGSSSRPAS